MAMMRFTILEQNRSICNGWLSAKTRYLGEDKCQYTVDISRNVPDGSSRGSVSLDVPTEETFAGFWNKREPIAVPTPGANLALWDWWQYHFESEHWNTLGQETIEVIMPKGEAKLARDKTTEGYVVFKGTKSEPILYLPRELYLDYASVDIKMNGHRITVDLDNSATVQVMLRASGDDYIPHYDSFECSANIDRDVGKLKANKFHSLFYDNPGYLQMTLTPVQLCLVCQGPIQEGEEYVDLPTSPAHTRTTRYHLKCVQEQSSG